MSKRVFLIHGWGGNPDKDWIPWANSELKKKGYEVIAPLMPDTDTPIIEAWVNKLKVLVGQPHSDDIFIGHSIGCQTILRFLGELPPGQKIYKVILVAPWTKLTNLENDEAWQIADPWFNTPIDFSTMKDRATSFTVIFSDNDEWVPLEDNRKFFKEKLNPEIIVLRNKGHFSEEEGVKEIPEILHTI